ncbi:DgyrCDS3703 [Dimorphilus gyrociliatus]|uniref:DgyrCDS3703 n=1 Tax=Dimorphilus gyrociliatus TaxID=2664684 RepID=A0A7I8VG85_9ANNE|nr:DgyrCDS3703 [Dimorphilus gyrociliatus]
MLFDDILGEIGEFGRYQIVSYVVLGMLAIPAGWHNLGITFYGNKLHHHWCRVKELDEFNNSIKWNVAIPRDDSDDKFEWNKCRMFNLNYSSYRREDFLNWNRSISENAGTIECNNGWDFVTGFRTVMQDFNLVCGRSALVSLIQSIYFTGFLLGTIVWGQFSDSRGRLKTVLITVVVLIVSSIAAAFVPSNNVGYGLFVTLRFFVGFGVGGSYTTAFVMAMEIIGPKFRAKAGIFVQVWFALGFMTLPYMAKAMPNYRTLQLVTGAIPAVFLLCPLVIDESARWLVAENQDEKAAKILEKIARWNNTTLPANLNLEENRKNIVSDRKYTVADLIKTPNLRKITLNMWVNWLVVSLVYYGLSLEAGNMGNLDFYLSNFISGAVEIPACLFTILILDRIGRKIPVLGTTLFGGASCLIAIAFMKNTNSVALTVCSVIGKFFVSMAFAVIYVWAAEVFPTVVRNVGVGGSSMAARVGSLAAPQIGRLKETWRPLPFVIFGGTSLISCVCSFFIPETLNKHLPETIEDGELFGTSKAKVKPIEDEVYTISKSDLGQENLDDKKKE